MPINQIWIPVTGQPEDAVMHHYALYFALKLGTSLLGVHAGSSKQPGEFTGTEKDDSPFQNFMRNCRNRGVISETQIRNTPWETALPEPGSADMLTVLPYGKGFRLQGLDVEKMACSSPTPVLFCPDSYIDIESIALAYDGGEFARKALDLAVWLSEKAAWPLTVLMVTENQEQGVQWMDDVEAYLDTLMINSTTVILSGPVDKALYRFMLEGSVEMLIMGAGGGRGERDDHIGQNTAAMINRDRFPLLVVA